jgi:hypothetical protein
VAQLKAGAIDILVATDVAARGLDVERISHVVTHTPLILAGKRAAEGRTPEAVALRGAPDFPRRTGTKVIR